MTRAARYPIGRRSTALLSTELTASEAPSDQPSISAIRTDVFTARTIPNRLMLSFGWRWLLLGAATALLVVVTQFVVPLDISVPFLPIGTVGTAVAFYLGFKNNSSYDRYWEARKIWGGVVNASRTWANQVLMFLDGNTALQESLIMRQVAWAHALRLNLRKTSRHEGSESVSYTHLTLPTIYSV